MEKINELPQELLLTIFNFFNKSDLFHSSIVNKNLHKLSKDKSLQNLPWPLLDYTQPPYEVKIIANNQNALDFIDLENILPTATAHTKLSNEDVVAACTDDTLKILDSKSAKCLGSIKKSFKGRISNLLALSNGHIISDSPSGILHVWNVKNDYKHLYSISNNKTAGTICSLVELPTGEVLSASLSGVLTLWDITNGKWLGNFDQLHQYKGRTSKLIVLPNKKQVAFLIMDSFNHSKIKVWDIESKEYLPNLIKIDDNNITSLYFLPNRQLITKSKTETKCWFFPELKLPNEANNTTSNNLPLSNSSP